MPALALPDPEARGWPVQGEWTYEDYARLPEDGHRYEVIRGVLHVTPAPSYDHQFISIHLASRLLHFVETHHLGTVLTAPFDVVLPGVASPVQPDIVVLKSEKQPSPGTGRFEGIPDLVVEILSPGTTRLDQHVKLEAYESAGVPEFWIVDPLGWLITVYLLDSQQGLFEEHGRFGPEDTLVSPTLPDFELSVAEIFPGRPF